MVFFQLLIFFQKCSIGFIEVAGICLDQLLSFLGDFLHPLLNAVGFCLELFGVVGGIELLAPFFKDGLLVFKQFIERIYEFLFQYGFRNSMGWTALIAVVFVLPADPSGYFLLCISGRDASGVPGLAGRALNSMTERKWSVAAQPIFTVSIFAIRDHFLNPVEVFRADDSLVRIGYVVGRNGTLVFDLLLVMKSGV